MFEILREQFYSKAPASIARPGLSVIQFVWLLVALVAAIFNGLFRQSGGDGALILAANAIFTALSVTMAMFFWPRAINLKADKVFQALDERWHVYRLTTQLFWTVLVGITATGLSVVQMAIPADWALVLTLVGSATIGLSVYQVLLLGQCVFRLYAATYWMPKA